MNDTPTAALVTVKVAADMLSISRSLCYGLVRSGSLGSVTIGRLRRVPVKAVVDYVDALLLDEIGLPRAAGSAGCGSALGVADRAEARDSGEGLQDPHPQTMRPARGVGSTTLDARTGASRFTNDA